MDVASRTGGTKADYFLALTILLLLVCSASFCCGQSDPNSELKQLADQERWSEIVREVEVSPVRDVDANYFYGIALAQLGRLNDAQTTLLRGEQLRPNDKRFPTELAGIAFKQKRYPEAASWLRRALRIDPSDSYANDFLATIYFVEGNLEAALKYWNRTDKPQLENVSTPSDLKIDPALVDRAFVFSPASMLRLPDLLTSEKRIDALRIFHQSNLGLSARDDGKFDLNFRAHELNGFGANRWAALLSVFRGVFLPDCLS